MLAKNKNVRVKRISLMLIPSVFDTKLSDGTELVENGLIEHGLLLHGHGVGTRRAGHTVEAQRATLEGNG